MIDIDATGMMVNPRLGWFSVAKCSVVASPKSIRVHPYQAFAIMDCYQTVIVKDRRAWYWRLLEKVKLVFVKRASMTFVGLPVIQKAEMDETHMEFLGEDGSILARVKNLAIPAVFEATSRG